MISPRMAYPVEVHAGQTAMNSTLVNRFRSRALTIRNLAWLFFPIFTVSLLIAGQAEAKTDERVPAEGKVIRLTLPLDQGQVSGVVASYTTLTFTLQTEAGEQHRVLWNMIPADKVDRYWRYLESPEGDAKALFELGDILIRHRDGEALAKQAFEQALALDPNLKEAVELSLAGKDPDGTPRFVGTADPQQWGDLSEDAMQMGVESLRGFCKRTQETLNIELKLYESDRFILLTDTDDEQVKSLFRKLLEGYHAAAELLGDDPSGNIFVGKCLVVLFDKRVDYVRFQLEMHQTDARGTGGLCHGFGNGHVHIAAYQRANQRQTNHIMVHELVHAYLHRYRSPVPLDDWVNEGLAEHLAHTIEPPPGQNLFLKTRLALEGKKGLGEGFFEGENLKAWQYDVAGALTTYMLERGKHAYPKLIQAIKDGKPAGEALESVYRMSPELLIQRFKRRLDRELNKSLGG